MAEGWVSIHRKIMDNPMWLKEKFDKPRAWIDLILLANHEPGYILFRGIKIELSRGDVGWSVDTLAKRWKWSRNKVNAFFGLLKSEKQIVSKTDIKTDIKLPSVISIVNYDLYQQNNTKKDIKRTLKGHKKDTNNNDNNDNKKMYVVNQDTKKEMSLVDVAQIILTRYNESMGGKFKTTKPFIDNLAIWLETYPAWEIERAIVKMPKLDWFKSMAIETLFRTRNKNGPCDYIGQILSQKISKENLLV